MHFRDKVVLIFGALLALGGSFSTFFWGVESGVVFLLVLGFLLVGLSVLQRRQLARVQQRTLDLLKAQQTMAVPSGSGSSEVAKLSKEFSIARKKSQQDLATSTAKVLGLIQAQHMVLDLLSDRLERIAKAPQGRHHDESLEFKGTDTDQD